MSAQHTIDTLRGTLETIITGWKSDGSSPPNFIRETGLGEEIARVDVWAGRVQNPHNPIIIGWKAHFHGNTGQFTRDVIRAQEFRNPTAAIEYAQAKADSALLASGWPIEDVVTTKHEPGPHLAGAYAALTQEFKHTVLSNEEEQGEYDSLAEMASEKGYPALAHALEPDDYPLNGAE